MIWTSTKSRTHTLPFCYMWLIQVLKPQKNSHLFVHFKKTYYLCTAKTVEWFDNFCSTGISNYDYQYVGVIPFLLKESRLGF